MSEWTVKQATHQYEGPWFKALTMETAKAELWCGCTVIYCVIGYRHVPCSHGCSVLPHIPKKDCLDKLLAEGKIKAVWRKTA